MHSVCQNSQIFSYSLGHLFVDTLCNLSLAGCLCKVGTNNDDIILKQASMLASYNPTYMNVFFLLMNYPFPHIIENTVH